MLSLNFISKYASCSVSKKNDNGGRISSQDGRSLFFCLRSFCLDSLASRVYSNPYDFFFLVLLLFFARLVQSPSMQRRSLILFLVFE